MIRKLFLLWGAENEDDEETTTETPKVTEEEPRTISTAELEQMTARAADKATRKAKRELATSLGFDSTAEMTEFISTNKKAAEEAQDEQTKALQAAQRKEKEYEAKMSALADERLNLMIERKVVAAGIGDPKRASRIAALVRDDLDSDLIEDEEAWGGAVADALQSVQEDMPELFAKSGFGSGDGGSKGKSTDDEDEAAKKEKQHTDRYANRGMVEYPG
jgi:hypothetical protein